MIKLSVNINKIALLRNSRGANIPDVLVFAKDCERYGADGITVHPRPDERHIRYSDVYSLKDLVSGEFNIEGYPDERFVKMVLEVCPHQVTLVPDAPDALTSDAGWKIKENADWLKPIIEKFQDKGIRVSLFIDPQCEVIDEAIEVGADRGELYTGPFAHDFYLDRERAIEAYVKSGEYALKNGFALNAGHDLNLDNLAFFAKSVPGVLEVSIGHALVRDCLYFGLENTVRMYKRELGLYEN